MIEPTDLQTIAEALIPLVESRLDSLAGQIAANNSAIIAHCNDLQSRVDGISAVLATDAYKRFIVGEAARLGVSAPEITRARKGMG